MMRSKTVFSLLLTFFCALTVLQAQVELKLQLQPDGKTYAVFARPQVDWVSPPANLTHAAQVTIVAPAGGFEVANIVSNKGTWQLATTVLEPVENPSADYFLVALVGATADISYKKNQELLLFTFENGLAGCPGPIELMDNVNDPFAGANSLGIPAGNNLEIEGGGVGENSFAGNYAPGSANCLYFATCAVSVKLTLEQDGYYHVALVPNPDIPPTTDPVGAVKVTVKVPTGYFRLHDLTNLQTSFLSFMGVNRYDSPLEEPDYDYIVFNMKTNGNPGLMLTQGTTIPLLKFGNEGSCQGDSIYLVNNTNDPFLAPNTQNADIGQSVMLHGGSTAYVSTCLSKKASAPCLPCAFTPSVVSIDSIRISEPIVCLGGGNGTIRIYASGPAPIYYSINGGNTWSTNPVFNGLVVGTYDVRVKSKYYGCDVYDFEPPFQLMKSSQFELKLDVPDAVCKGSDLKLGIQSPQPLPAGTKYSWTGPSGFTSNIPDPVLLNVSTFTEGNYTLTVTPPGCTPATSTTYLSVPTPVEQPAIIVDGPICDGDSIRLHTETQAAKYEWIGPLGQSPGVLALPGLTTSEKETSIPKNHKAYMAGDWKVRVTDVNGCVVEGTAQPLTIKARPQAFAANDGPVCQGENVTLLSNPIPGVEYRWYKSGQTGVWSTQPYPKVPNVITSETFYLEVVKNQCSSENLAVTTVTLHPKPTVLPEAEYTPAVDCSPQDLQLIANHFGTATQFLWSGPNGFQSQLENPVVPNANATYNGSYLLKATNFWGCSTQEAFLVDNIVDPLDKPLIQTPGPVCPGETLQLSVQNYQGSNVNYQWRHNGNAISGANLHTLFVTEADLNDEGAYDVVVTVDDCILKSDSFLVDLLNAPVSQLDFFLSDPCEGGTLQLYSNTNDAVAWEWKGPNSFTSLAPDPIIYNTVFANVGAYTLTVTGNNGCTKTTSIVIDGILPNPATPLAASNSPVCPEDTIVCQVQNPPQIGTVYYQWINGNGVTLAETEATLKIPASGPFAVSPFFVKTYVNGCASPLSAPISVTISIPPAAQATNNGPVCPGEPVQLFASPVPQGQYQWRIVGQSQAFSFEQNPVVNFQNTTLVELHVTALGCETESVTTMAVPVFPVPEASGLPVSTTYCSGESAVLAAENLTPLVGPLTYKWTGPPATGFNFTGTTAPNQPFSLTIPNLSNADEGAYTLVMTSADGCQSQAVSTFVDVVQTPAAPQVSVNKTILCEGETLELNANSYPSNNVVYEWYFDNGFVNMLLGTTTDPTYFVPSAMASNTGIYSAKVLVDGCTSGVSNKKNITVLGISTNLVVDNSTTDTAPACEGDVVELGVPFMAGATYDWYGPNGFQSSLPDPTLPNVSVNQAGSYFVVVALPGCNATASATTTVYVKPKPPTPVLTGPSNVCEGTDITISVSNWVNGAEYDFYFGTSLISSGPSSALNFNNVTPNQFGAYSVVARIGQCETEPSDYVWLFVDELPNELADAGDDQTICPGEELAFLEANKPSVGTGKWTALTEATILDENDPTTQAMDLAEGEHTFVWSLSNGACVDYSSDTVTFDRATPVEAFQDVYFLAAGETLNDKNLLANDFIPTGQHVLFFLLNPPSKGSLQHLGNGHINYTPLNYAIGLDQFKYSICDVDCPDLCDTATVRINLKAPVSASDCFVPNLITPNEDGENETFFVPCIEAFPGSRLSIYNRYGNKIYETEDYQNDWRGTYKGKPLPDGTYYYQLTFNDATRTAIQGYLVVLR